MNYITTKLTQEDIDQIEEFADKRFTDKSSKKVYEKRGTFKRSDIVIGAAAEIGVYKALNRAGIKVGPPDFKIYKSRQKSFAHDLTDGDKHFMVKGQSLESAARYSASWAFQKEDPYLKVPTPDTYVVTCVVDYDKRIVYIYACVPLMTLVREDLFDNMVLKYYQTNKIALYLRRLTSCLTTNQRWSILYNK